MKKTILSVLAAGLLVLSGCGAAQNEVQYPTLKWILPGAEQPDMERVSKKIDEILEEKAGCRLEFQFIDINIYTEYMNMINSSDTAYDLCFTGYINPYPNAVYSKSLYPIDDELEKYPELKESIPDYIWDSMRIDGSVYAVPNMQILSSGTCVCISKTLFEEYGQLDENEIKYMTDLEPFLEWVKQNHPERYPYQCGHIGGLDKEYDYSSEGEICRGVYVIEKDGELLVENEFKLEHRLDEARFAEDWYNKGYIRKDIALVNDESTEAAELKFATVRTIYKPGIESEFKAQRGEDAIVISLTEPTVPYGIGTTTMTGIGKNSQYPEQAMKIINLMNTDKELYNLVCFGIEGVHYTLTDGKYVQKKEDAGYNPGSSWRFGNQFNAYLLEGQPEDVWEQTKKMNDKAKKSKLMGFKFDKSNVLNEIIRLETVCNRYQSFYKGYLPIDSYYDEMLAELEEAGIETVIKEVEVQLAEFQRKNAG